MSEGKVQKFSRLFIKTSVDEASEVLSLLVEW